jgi:hypothetical protein
VTYDLAGAASQDLGVRHIYERLPITVTVASFRDKTGGDAPITPRELARCTDSFTTSLRRTELFEHVVAGTGDHVELGFIGEVTRFGCTQTYACVWSYYSFFALIAFSCNLPLSIDDAVYDLTVRATVPTTGQTLGTYKASVHLHSWRGSWSFFETFLQDPGQVFDRVNQEILNQVVDDYARFRNVALLPAPAAPDAASRGDVK